jgi:hypothetical protein
LHKLKYLLRIHLSSQNFNIYRNSLKSHWSKQVFLILSHIGSSREYFKIPVLEYSPFSHTYFFQNTPMEGWINHIEGCQKATIMPKTDDPTSFSNDGANLKCQVKKKHLNILAN